MSYLPFTNVPNSFFPLVSTLGYAELKVLLVIIRQTYGFVDNSTKKHKQYDWISGRFFVKKTALSQRSVSKALSLLIDKGLVEVKNEQGRVCASTNQRKKAYRSYYRFIPPP